MELQELMNELLSIDNLWFVTVIVWAWLQHKRESERSSKHYDLVMRLVSLASDCQEELVSTPRD